jgi:hypothetical protein
MPSILEDSQLHRADKLAELSPGFDEARREAQATADHAAQARAAVEDLRRRKAKTEEDADRAALEAVKGRGPEDAPRTLTPEADRLGEEIEAAEKEAQQAEAEAAAAQQTATEIEAAERLRIADEVEGRFRVNAGAFAARLVELDRLAKESKEISAEMVRLGIGIPFRSMAYSAMKFLIPGTLSYDGADTIVNRVRNAGIEVGALDGMSKTQPPIPRRAPRAA